MPLDHPSSGDPVIVLGCYGGDQSRTPATIERVVEVLPGAPLVVVAGRVFRRGRRDARYHGSINGRPVALADAP